MVAQLQIPRQYRPAEMMSQIPHHYRLLSLKFHDSSSTWLQELITEISSASRTQISDEVIHGPELILKHSKKGQKLYKVVKN
jgi:hypothetical protein